MQPLHHRQPTHCCWQATKHWGVLLAWHLCFFHHLIICGEARPVCAQGPCGTSQAVSCAAWISAGHCNIAGLVQTKFGRQLPLCVALALTHDCLALNCDTANSGTMNSALLLYCACGGRLLWAVVLASCRNIVVSCHQGCCIWTGVGSRWPASLSHLNSVTGCSNWCCTSCLLSDIP